MEAKDLEDNRGMINLNHNNFKKNFALGKIFFKLIILILLISISGCKGKSDKRISIEDVRTGIQGLVIYFQPNAPPDKIHVDAEPTFDVILELRNLGAFPQPEELAGSVKEGDFGRVYITGYDPNIVSFNPIAINLNDRRLGGRSTINPNGGEDVPTFKGAVNLENLNVIKYEPILLVTLCYNYITIAGPPVCIDPRPYSPVNERKVCEAQDISLSSQGAPIAITKIEEEALAQKTLFKITVKNVGGGDVIKNEAFEKCNPSTNLFGGENFEREDLDKVFLDGVLIGNKQLQCGPFVDGKIKDVEGDIRLLNGEGSIVCELPKSDYAQVNSAYTTPLQIVLSYVYRTSIQKQIQIIKESISLGGS